MGRSVVYFTDMRATPERNLLQKFRALIERAGIADINFEKQFTAIKIHLGEPGNIAYLRPNFAKVVADKVKELGGKPFLTDSNTLYVGRRKDALEHLEAAYENGYNPFCTGCHVVIADGLKGTDEALVPVEGGEYIKEAKIGRAIADADVIISLTHFKGHEITGFGGAIKNLGMGSGSRGGKMEMHSDGKPSVDEAKCIGCGRCARNCAQKAIRIIEGKAHIDHEKCVGCGRCVGACNFDAIDFEDPNSNQMLNYRIAEYAKAVVDGRPQFHISMVMDISPNCDCHEENDAPILPDVGMFASFDPLALDQACVDACLKCEPLPNSQLGEHLRDPHFEDHHDHFTNSTPESEWQSCLSHAEKIGLGTRAYELIKL